jgi:hypothetical protein
LPTLIDGNNEPEQVKPPVRAEANTNVPDLP